MPRRPAKAAKDPSPPPREYAPTARLLAQIEAAFLEFPARFAFRGAIPLDAPQLEGLALFCQTDEGQPTRTPLPLTPETAPAFGGMAAGQLPATHFAFTVDPLAASGVLAQVQEYMELDQQLVALPKALTVLVHGGPAQDHVQSEDTPPRKASKSKAPIGTISLRLPSPFSGGELVVRNGDTEQIHSYIEASVGKALEWSFLTADCETDVRELSHGHCITVSYDVFPAPSAGSAPPDQRLVSQLKEALADPSFFPNGGVLAFALQQGYSADHSCPQIVGTDAVWEASLKAAGLTVRGAELYDPNDHHDSNGCEEKARQKHKKRTAPFSYKDREYPWSFQFGAAQDINWGEPPLDLLYEWLEPEKNYPGQPISWVTLHRKWGGIANYVVDYGGGDMSLESVYKNVALIAVVPEARLRKCVSVSPRKTAENIDSGKGDSEQDSGSKGGSTPTRKRARTAR